MAFRMLENIVARELYAGIAVPVTDDQGNQVFNRETGEPISQIMYFAQVPIVQRFLGANEDDPISVTGGLWAETPDGVRYFDLDRHWAYLSAADVMEIYLTAHASERAVNVQSLRAGPIEARLLSLAGSDAGVALAEKLGLQHGERHVTLSSGERIVAGRMEIVITEAALATAFTLKKFPKAPRLEGLAGPATKASQANEHLTELVAHIRQAGDLPAKVKVPTAREAAQRALASDITSRFAPSVATTVQQRSSGNRSFQRSRPQATTVASRDEVPF